MSSKFPLVVLLAELAEQIRTRNLELDLVWVPREQNEEADSLTNGDYTAFDPSLRIHVDISAVQWLVLDELMSVATALYDQVRLVRACCNPGAVPAPRTRPEERLRQREPW